MRPETNKTDWDGAREAGREAQGTDSGTGGDKQADLEYASSCMRNFSRTWGTNLKILEQYQYRDPVFHGHLKQSSVLFFLASHNTITPMESLHNCFVDQVIEPVQFVEVAEAPTQSTRHSHQQLHFSTLQELTTHFDHVSDSNYTCRYMFVARSVCPVRPQLLLLTFPRSICQRNSWRPLQITKPMLDLIVSKHEISPSFWDLPSCFYTRNLDLEEVFCIPYTESRNDSFIGTSSSGSRGLSRNTY